MAVVKCEKGHYYDTNQYEECPVCWQNDFGYEEEDTPDTGLLSVAFYMAEHDDESENSRTP